MAEQNAGTTGQQAKGSQLTKQESGISRREPYGFGFGPLGLMRQLSEDMDRLFEGFGFGRGLVPSFGREMEREFFAPKIDVFEKEGALCVRADLPGVSRDDVNVELQDEALILSGERKREQESEERGTYRSEVSYGSFQRVIPLPEGADLDKADASFKDGVLNVRIPFEQRRAERGRKLEVKGEEKKAEAPVKH